MATSAGNTRTRSRKKCCKCNQLLSYSAYKRHENPLVCAEAGPSNAVTGTFLQKGDNESFQDSSEIVHNVTEANTSDGLANNTSSDEDEGIEVINEDINQVSQQYINNPSDQPLEMFHVHKPLIRYVCHFVSFFQLCYKISDRVITLLLIFLRTLLFWIALLIPNQGAEAVNVIANSIPKNNYFLKKYFTTSGNIRTYIVCPKCCNLYLSSKFPTYHNIP